MLVSLSPSLAKFVDEQIKAGRYASTDEALNSAVARLQSDAEISALDLDHIRADLDPALAQADRNEFSEFTASDIIAERRAARDQSR
jgi:putative addiction module CopG family antidote